MHPDPCSEEYSLCICRVRQSKPRIQTRDSSVPATLPEKLAATSIMDLNLGAR